MTLRRSGTPATLADVVRALGGDLYERGLRASVPAPGHSPGDRSISLRLVDGRVLVHSFGSATWREVLDDLRARGLVDAQHRLTGDGPGASRAAPPDATRAQRTAAAVRLWAQGGPVTPDLPAGRYCIRRGVAAPLEALAALRAHAAAPAGVYRGRGPFRPALLAAVHDATGALTAVEVTYLDHEGRRSALARPPRKLVGVLPAGSAVRLAPPAAELLVAEGVFTTLSAIARFGLPGWALLSATNLRRWTAPAGVRRVLIAADRGLAGEAAAAALAAQLGQGGLEVTVVPPPAPFGDWNEAETAEREGDEGRPARGEGP